MAMVRKLIMPYKFNLHHSIQNCPKFCLLPSFRSYLQIKMHETQETRGRKLALQHFCESHSTPDSRILFVLKPPEQIVTKIALRKGVLAWKRKPGINSSLIDNWKRQLPPKIWWNCSGPEGLVLCLISYHWAKPYHHCYLHDYHCLW